MIQSDKLTAYFNRIGYSGPTEATIETLRAIHRTHLLAVPFENLNIHIGRPISIDPGAIYEKIVHNRRGGFCYEQNGLLSVILRSMGFDVTLLEARVRRAENDYGIPFGHLTLMVVLDQRWLFDVGYGDSFREPLLIDEPGDQIQGDTAFRITHNGQRGVYSRRLPDADWHEEYEFYLTPRTLTDFADGCHYHQTSPNSTFTQKRLCSLATPDGRITLSGDTFITTRNGQREERHLILPDEFNALLRSHFGINLA